jgi:hypothetical protein
VLAAAPQLARVLVDRGLQLGVHRLCRQAGQGRRGEEGGGEVSWRYRTGREKQQQQQRRLRQRVAKTCGNSTAGAVPLAPASYRYLHPPGSSPSTSRILWREDSPRVSDSCPSRTPAGGNKHWGGA